MIFLFFIIGFSENLSLSAVWDTLDTLCPSTISSFLRDLDVKLAAYAPLRNGPTLTNKVERASSRPLSADFSFNNKGFIL